MKIAVIARTLFRAESADQIRRFTDGLLLQLARNYPQHLFYLLFDNPPHLRFNNLNNVTLIRVKPAGRHPLLVYWWYQVSLPRQLQKIKPDILFSFSINGLTVFKTALPRLTLIIPAGRARETSLSKYLDKKYFRRFAVNAVQTPERLLMVLDDSQQVLAPEYGITENKTEIIKPAVNKYFKIISFAQQVLVREKFAGGESYFFLAELPEDQTTLTLIMQSFDLMKVRTGNSLKLVIARKKKQLSRSDIQILNNLKFPEAVVFTGQVTAEDLADFYGAAVATLYIPNVNGLNLPVLEAQQCGCPVICLESGSEISLVKHGVFLVNPPTTENYFEALVRVYHNLELRAQLVEQGRQNAQRYTWEDSTKKVMEILEEVVKTKKDVGAPV